MPKRIKEKIKKSAKEKGLKEGSRAYNRYVYGTLKEISDKS